MCIVEIYEYFRTPIFVYSLIFVNSKFYYLISEIYYYVKWMNIKLLYV